VIRVSGAFLRFFWVKNRYFFFKNSIIPGQLTAIGGSRTPFSNISCHFDVSYRISRAP
jgi:hypothetical protein